MSHLDTLRRAHALAATRNPFGPSGRVDADLAEEAGMDGNLGRLLQAARDLDTEAARDSQGPKLALGTGETGYWFQFTLAFAHGGPDGDTVRAVLGLRSGWVVNVDGQDVVVDGITQDDDVYADFPVFLDGWRYDERSDDEHHRGERVRLPLRNARVTVY